MADVVSLHCPLTAETRHLIDTDALRAMKSTAVLVNTTRGAVVDEAALAEALRSGEIAGAALDVYEREPEVHRGLLDLENVVLAPHLGSGTHEARVAMGMLCVEGLRAVLFESRPPANALNPYGRGADMTLTPAITAAFSSALGPDGVLSAPEQLKTYECDGLTGHRVVPALVVLPRSTHEVQAAVRICAEHALPFVARGAGTGLSGGALPTAKGVVISSHA